MELDVSRNQNEMKPIIKDTQTKFMTMSTHSRQQLLIQVAIPSISESDIWPQLLYPPND